MSPAGPSELRLAYRLAFDHWIAAIRAEAALAVPDHGMTAMEKWDEAYLKEQEARDRAVAARDAYKDALRSINYGI